MHGEATNKKKILVYEDDPTFRSSFVSALETRGFEVIVANAPSETSIEDVKKMMPDMISLDIMMPGKTGLEWLKELRNEADLVHVPAVIVSSLADEQHKEEAYKLGIKAYLIKFQTPITTIVREIDNLLQTDHH